VIEAVQVVEVAEYTDLGVMDQPIAPKLVNIMKVTTTAGPMALIVLTIMRANHVNTDHQVIKKQQQVIIQWEGP
jgi:hypothetical protein